jgi:hypothetical protein
VGLFGVRRNRQRSAAVAPLPTCYTARFATQPAVSGVPGPLAL